HHSAQKSTTTGVLASSTSARKLSSLIFVVAMLRSPPEPSWRSRRWARRALHRSRLYGPPAPGRSRSVAVEQCILERHQARPVGPQQGTADGSTGIDAPQNRAVCRHLGEVERRHLRGGRGRRTLRLEVEDQNLFRGDAEP